MRILTLWLLGLAMLPAVADAQTRRQSNIRSPWDEPDQPRPRGDRLLRAVMLDTHNAERRAVDMAPVTWDAALAAQALAYAQELARLRLFQHSTKASRPTPQGENLWMGSRSAFTYEEMTDAWVREKRYYRPRPVPDFSTTGDWRDVGHYTQMVWHNVTAIGCAVASNDRDDYLVCRYSPPGNIFGRTIFGTEK